MLFRSMEFDRQVIGLRAEKSSLEQRLKDAQSAQNSNASAGPGGPDPKMVKELEELRAKLKEYEVIEDDLANLKKFQKENEELKARISQLESGGAALKVIPGGAPAPEATTTIPSATQKIETPVEKVSAAPAPVAAAPAPAQPETNTNVLAPVNPGDGDSSKKKEEELLSEFEKMLAS